jgi:hypothetical protein
MKKISQTFIAGFIVLTCASSLLGCKHAPNLSQQKAETATVPAAQTKKMQMILNLTGNSVPELCEEVFSLYSFNNKLDRSAPKIEYSGNVDISAFQIGGQHGGKYFVSCVRQIKGEDGESVFFSANSTTAKMIYDGLELKKEQDVSSGSDVKFENNVYVHILCDKITKTFTIEKQIDAVQ